MAKIISDDLELEFKFLGCYDYQPVEFEFKVTLLWKGVPILNENVMKRRSTYWEKGKEGGIIAEEMDNFTLITDLEDSIKSKTVKIWESWPDPDMCISIYPERCFPYLNEINNDYYTIIVSPDMYQFKESDAYGGYEGVSFIMTPEKKEFQNFINELKKEYHELIEGKNLKL